MKLNILYALLFIAFLSPAYAGDASHAQIRFHPPQSQAEKALDHILMLDKDERSLSGFIFKASGRDKSKDGDYSSLFTRALQDAWARAYLSIPSEDKEGGRYVPIDFIVCGQETSDKYLYATVKGGKDVAYIAAVWPQNADMPASAIPYPYRMIKAGGVWKLDGVRCPAGFSFNTNFHYDR